MEKIKFLDSIKRSSTFYKNLHNVLCKTVAYLLRFDKILFFFLNRVSIVSDFKSIPKRKQSLLTHLCVYRHYPYYWANLQKYEISKFSHISLIAGLFLGQGIGMLLKSGSILSAVVPIFASDSNSILPARRLQSCYYQMGFLCHRIQIARFTMHPFWTSHF